MTEFFQHMINMLILGSTYALLGIGLTLIFGIMRIVNFAHGELYAFGAYFVYFVAVLLGFNFFLSLLIAMLAGCILGSLIEVVLLRPMRGADIDTTMLIMIGAMIVMQNTEQYVWGGVAKSVSTPLMAALARVSSTSMFCSLWAAAASCLFISRWLGPFRHRPESFRWCRHPSPPVPTRVRFRN